MSTQTSEEFEDPSSNPAVKTSLLPQYIKYETISDRFLRAIHYPDCGLERAENMRGIKYTDSSEIHADGYSYFIENKQNLEHEFLAELSDSMGDSKAKEFCDAISIHWFSGAKGWQDPSIIGLKAGVRDYLSHRLNGKSLDTVVIEFDARLPPSTFTAIDISKILTVNDRLMAKHLEKWKYQHTSFPFISTANIFLRRGLGLDTLFPENTIYRERDFISSYSFALSTPEKFSQMKENLLPVLINGDIELFSERILFFSPFIPSMPVQQLEVGVIPALRGLPISYQGLHSHIHEYILDPRCVND